MHLLLADFNKIKYHIYSNEIASLNAIRTQILSNQRTENSLQMKRTAKMQALAIGNFILKHKITNI